MFAKGELYMKTLLSLEGDYSHLEIVAEPSADRDRVWLALYDTRNKSVLSEFQVDYTNKSFSFLNVTNLVDPTVQCLALCVSSALLGPVIDCWKTTGNSQDFLDCLDDKVGTLSSIMIGCMQAC